MLARKTDTLNTVFFLMALMTYIQVLKVKLFKDTCFILLIGLKSNVGRREMDSMFHTPNLFKGEKASSEERMSEETHQSQ